MNVSTFTPTASTDADKKAASDLPVPAVAPNSPIETDTSAPVHRDERPLAGVVAALNDHERLEVERLRRAAQEELVARQRFD